MIYGFFMSNALPLPALSVIVSVELLIVMPVVTLVVSNTLTGDEVSYYSVGIAVIF